MTVSPDRPVTETEFRALAAACDRLLRAPESPLERTATPWLHVLSHHPAVFERYARVLGAMRGRETPPLGRVRSLLASAALVVRAAGWRAPRLPQGPFDAIFVSRIGSRADLDRRDDLMFGDLPARLADRGLRCLVLLRDHTAAPAGLLADVAHREAPVARMLLPRTGSVARELRALRGILRERRQLTCEAAAASGLDRVVARHAADEMRPAVVAEGLRLRAQVAEACGRWRPRLLVVTYEGHAWEKCAASGALAIDPSVGVVGYQHTLMWPHSHAVLRRVRRERGLDPDVILTCGEVTRDLLASSEALGPTEIGVLGSYRRPRTPASAPSASRHVIVLPDGFRAETLGLFSAAIEAARSLPDVRFILRPHPVLPMACVAPELPQPPANVEVSDVADLNEDVARVGAVLYRGSSTVVTAVLAGLKPYYLERPGEMTIDLLDGVEGWRERVADGRALAARHRAHLDLVEHARAWEPTRAHCDRMLMPIDDRALDRLARLADPPS